MLDLKKYPLSEAQFKALIEPLIEQDKQKSGRPVTLSHYHFFCGILYVL